MAKSNKTYRVQYKMFSADMPHNIDVLASNKEEAYDNALDALFPEVPYSAWVYSVTYGNGRYVQFNTFEGKRF